MADAAKKYWSEMAYAPGGVVKDMDYARFATGIHPSLQGIKIVETLGGYSHDVRRQVRERNAVDLYNLPF